MGREHQNVQKIKARSQLLAKYGAYVGENLGPLPYYGLFTQSVVGVDRDIMRRNRSYLGF